jgi:hypothetical protein
VRFADGRVVVAGGAVEGAGSARGEGGVRPVSAGIGSRGGDAHLWMHPLPPDGPVDLVCEWPTFGIPESLCVLDGGELRAAARRALAPGAVKHPRQPPPEDFFEAETRPVRQRRYGSPFHDGRARGSVGVALDVLLPVAAGPSAVVAVGRFVAYPWGYELALSAGGPETPDPPWLGVSTTASLVPGTRP